MGSPTDARVSTSVAQEVICDSKPDVSLVDKILHQLSDTEKEQAARASSYRYLVASTSPTEQGDDERDGHAKATIQRYVTVEQKLCNNESPDVWEEVALIKLKNTLKFREEQQVDAIRLCFNKGEHSDNNGAHANIRDKLEERFATKYSIIRGYTKEGHALFQNFAKNDSSWPSEEYFHKGTIYMMERALACTERTTDGGKGKVVVLYDYNGYRMKNTPPPMMIKQLLSNLRDHWPERLEHVFIVDAPFIFRAFWAIIKHFVDPITKELVQFIAGKEEKRILSDMISEDQAAPYMFDGAKDEQEADMKKFFYDTPFDQVYDEKLS